MASPPPADRRAVRFGVFEVDFGTGDVRKRGMPVRLQPQPLQVLELLVNRRGELISREEFHHRLWPSDTFVDFDHGLNKAVNRLREVLGDSADSPRFIETLPKRGYRFIASVELAESRHLTPPIDAGPATDIVAAPLPAASARADGDASPPPAANAGHRRRSYAAVVAVGLGLAAAVVWLARPVDPRPAPRPERTLLAVLPFVNIAGDADQEYFCDGMTEEMILQLSALRPDRLGVIARTSAMHYKGRQMRVDAIARELGVGYVLEGTVRRSGARVRITASLVQRDQTPLWSESFERDLSGVLEIQRDVAQRIAASLALELLPPDGVQSAGAPQATPEAYEAFLRGRYQWNTRTPAGLERALVLLEDAVARDPAFVPAQTALADALNVLPWYGLRPPREAYPRSKAIAARALVLDARSAQAHTALAYAHHYFDWNWADAEREYRQALELNPNYAQARQWLAAHYAEMGQFDRALEEERHAQLLDPRSLVINAAIGWIHYLGRRHDEAITQLQNTLALDPTFVPAHLWLGQALEATGRYDLAIRQYLEVRRIVSTAPTGLGELARAHALAGDFPAARRALDDLRSVARTRYVEADLFARVFDALGERENALLWLERGFEERAVKMVLVGVDPQYDRLRGEPRFDALLTRLALPASAHTALVAR